jgi:uncharacterized protein (DUF736 family)
MAEEYQLKNGQGSIFKNEKAEGNQPTYRGTFKDITGEMRDISLWVKESKSGKKYFSVAVKEPYVKGESSQQSSPQPSKPKQTNMEDESENLPF